ncbi:MULTISPECIES: carbohydrate kinase [Sporosarcina]|uniref:carbohydrate kinase n=1 Tax=Sporosarcina TaxID=1569 RepID=UPI000A9276B6|nr:MULTISPECIES: carbohydrate kinase [Sporosarcina]WJY26913.1 winged helix-turn-helix transcriptional regulator [Sporosarcina sp. 0.2-SM1T-5]
MNEKEHQLLQLLRRDPYCSQQELADQLGLSRPAVANLISSLTKRGYIEGRAYVLAEEEEIICIGGANVDRKFHVQGPVAQGTSNPSSLSVTIGGVARNVAENLGRLGHPVRLLTTAGSDADWELIAANSAAYMDLSSVRLLPDRSTGSYSAVLDPDGELVIAMAVMDVYEALDAAYISEMERRLARAKLIVTDLNVSKVTVQCIRTIARRHGVPFAIVPVSGPKMANLPDSLEGLDWFICNEDEAEMLTGTAIRTMEDWLTAVRQLLDQGIEHVIITRGRNGIAAGDRTTGIIRHHEAIAGVHVEDVTGAGDAFVSGTLHAAVTGNPLQDAVRYGLVNAAKTLASDSTVRPELTAAGLQNELEELS